MSAPAVKALATSIYDALDESGILRELDNEQVWAVAELAAQAIEAAGTTKAIIRAWLDEAGITADKLQCFAISHPADLDDVDEMREWSYAIREVTS
jgi:hypothetical protein